MHYLGIRGDIKAGTNIISLLKDLGATNSWQYTGMRADWVYCLGCNNIPDIRAYRFDDVKDNSEYIVFSYEDFLAHYPLWVKDTIDIPGDFEKGSIILEVAWSELVGDIMYKTNIKKQNTSGGGVGWWYHRDLFNTSKPAIYNRQKPQQKLHAVMNFGNALALLKAGKKVARTGWNGKGMYLWLKPAITIKAEWCKDPMLKEIVDANGGAAEALGTICMKTADGKILTGWLASQTDMLSDDWIVIN